MKSTAKTFTALARYTSGEEHWITYKAEHPQSELRLGERKFMLVGHKEGVPFFREYQEMKVRL